MSGWNYKNRDINLISKFDVYIELKKILWWLLLLNYKSIILAGHLTKEIATPALYQLTNKKTQTIETAGERRWHENVIIVLILANLLNLKTNRLGQTMLAINLLKERNGNMHDWFSVLKRRLITHWIDLWPRKKVWGEMTSFVLMQWSTKRR